MTDFGVALSHDQGMPLFANENSGIVGGISLIITTMGFIGTLWALRVTFLQLVKTKGAEEAAINTAIKLKSRISFFDVTIENLKASKSLENALSHLRAKSWLYASQNLWEAQISLNRILPTITDKIEQRFTENALERLVEHVRTLEEADDKKMDIDPTSIISLIREQIIAVDKRIVTVQRNIFDD